MHSSKKIIGFILFTFIVFGKFQSQNLIKSEYNFRNYTTDNGLPSSETYDVEQDNDGNIWIATDRGAVKYDGQKFITYTKKDGFLDDVIVQIYKDPFGKIWFLTTGKDLFYYENRKIRAYRYNYLIRKHLKGNDELEKKLIVTNDNAVVLSVNNAGLITIDKHGQPTKSMQINYSTYVFSYGKQDIWSLYSYCLNRNLKIPTDIYLIENKSKPTFILRDDCCDPRKKMTRFKNDIYLLNNNSIINIQTHKKISTPFKNVIIHINGIGDLFWTGYLSHGVQAYTVSKGKFILKKSLLENYSVSNVFKDSKGGYWFSTLEAGIFYLPYFEIQGYTQKTGLIADEIKSLVEIKNDLYIGYNGLGIQKISNSTEEKVLLDYQYSIVANLNNKLLLSAVNQGLVLDNKKIIIEWSRDLYSLQDYCLGVCKYIYKIKPNGSVDKLTISKGDFMLFFAIMEDNEKIIWLGNKEGLYCYKNKKLTPFQPKNFNYKVTDLIYNPSWGKVVGTRDEGLFLINNDKITPIKGLLSDDITSLFVDPKGKLWVGTKKGVNILSKTKSGKIKIDCLTKSQGLYSNEITSIYVNTKYAWIGTKKGLSKVDLTYFSRPQGTYKIKLNSILLANKSLDVSKKIRIPYSEDLVKINFGTIDFISKGLYRYRLNHTSKWTYVTKPQIILLNPEDGNYQLEASFLNENNVWSAIQTIANFEITPPFWRTIFFKLMIILIVAYFIFLFIRYKKRQFETKQKVLVLEQKALFAQMNPHFIFNTLNSIQSFHLYNELDKAEYFLGKFSKLLRETLHVSRKASVSLKTEIGMLEKYLELEQMRFSNKFKWNIQSNIVDQNLTLRIPSMLIQPYVENSIKHGFTEKREDYQIDIILTQVDEVTLKCEVIDNGIGRSVSIQKKEAANVMKEHISYGEKITKERLKSYNKRKKDVYQSTIIDTIEDGVSKGTKVEVIIPLL